MAIPIRSTRQDEAAEMSTVVEIDIFIIGAGPAGGSLAAFLAQNGLTALMISNAPGTSDTPRAHLVNPSTIECMRDIGLEDAAYKVGTHGAPIENMRWCQSLLGEEYGRAHSWGSAPKTTMDVLESTPCKFIDLPQTLMEPLFIKYATDRGISCRFSTTLINVERKNGFVYSTVEDLITKSVYQVKSRYLFGCDGGRSMVARSIKAKYESAPSGGVACNILLEADVGDRMQDRLANLHWVMQPDVPRRFGLAPVIRMIKPWFQWMIVCVTPDAVQDPFEGLTKDSPELIQYVKDVFGDQSLEIKILRIDPWVIRESVAEKFSDGHDIFMLGDSVHRHPPVYGLGSNTCVQEAFNLAWKIAYVEKGIAGQGLLDTYNDERQETGAHLVKESNEGLRRHADVWAALGMFAESPTAGAQALKELSEVNNAGAARRAQLHAALEEARRELESLGLTRNQVYVSHAVYLEDEGPAPKFEGDPIIDTLITSRPGNRLPHAWLMKGVLPGKQLSTIDLAGHGAFTLFTGHGGNAWRVAAQSASKVLGVPINCYSIGWGLDYHDVYRDWFKKRDIEEDGMLLVRPDRYVAWRSAKLIPNAEEKLLHVFKHILSRD